MQFKTNTAAAISTLLAPFFLTACGGGGNDSNEPLPLTAAHCFDDTRYQLGKKIQQEYLEGNLKYPLLRTVETTTRNTNFGGHKNLIEYTATISIAEEPSIQLRRTLVYLTPEAPFVYWTYGSITEILGDFPAKYSTVYSEPVINRRAMLKQGESLSYRIRGEQTSDQYTEKHPVDETYTQTYLGDETVMIGDRKVNACKFDIVTGNSSSREFIYRSLPVLRSSIDEKSIYEKTIKLTLDGKDY